MQKNKTALSAEDVWVRVTGKNETGDKELPSQKTFMRVLKDSSRSLDLILSRMPQEPKVAVDIGAGYGLLSVNIAARGIKVIAIEPSGSERNVIKWNIKTNLKSKKNITVVKGFAESLNLKDGSADLCILSQVLEHAENPNKAISEAYRVLKKGGYLYIASPNYLFPVEQHYNLIYFPLMPKRLFSLWAILLFKKLNIRGVKEVNKADFSKVESFVFSLNYVTDLRIRRLLEANRFRVEWSRREEEKNFLKQIALHWRQDPRLLKVPLILISLPVKIARSSLAFFGVFPVKLEYLAKKDY